MFAHSPQARGRGERINGTFQGRLASELQYHRIHHLDAATRYLNETFIPEYNRLFAVPPKNPKAAWRAIPPGFDLRSLLSICEDRQVSNDNTFWFERVCYQIRSAQIGQHFVRATIEVQKDFKGVVRAKHPKHGYLEIVEIERKSRRADIPKTRRPLTESLLQAPDKVAVT